MIIEVGLLPLIKESGQTINSYLMRDHLGDIMETCSQTTSP